MHNEQKIWTKNGQILKNVNLPNTESLSSPVIQPHQIQIPLETLGEIYSLQYLETPGSPKLKTFIFFRNNNRNNRYNFPQVNTLPHKSVIHRNKLVLNNYIAPSRLSYLQLLKMDNLSNDKSLNDTSSLPHRGSTNLMLLANPDLPASPTTFNDADIEAFETKYSLDIAPLFAKYCTEFNLEIGNKKRKDNPNITPAMVHPSAPGFAVIWNLLHSIATSHIDLPEVHALRSAIAKPDQPAPSALTQAIENLVCTPRTQRRSTEDVITDVCDRLKLWKASLPTPSDAVNDNLLVTLNYAAYFLGKLVKNSFHTTLKEDRDRLEAQSLVVVLGNQKSCSWAQPKDQNLGYSVLPGQISSSQSSQQLLY